jgi:hypothetical protein
MRYEDVKVGQRVWSRHLKASGVVEKLDPEHWTPQTVLVTTSKFPEPVSWLVDDLQPMLKVVA